MLGAAAAVAAVVVLTPVRPAPPGPAPAAAQPSAARTPSRTPPPIPPAPRIRCRSGGGPGERVDAGQGYTVWLTEEGKHWNGPEEYENFRSAVDGNVDTSEPGVSHQSEGARRAPSTRASTTGPVRRAGSS